MQVQTIKNHNNLTHKAHFKNDANGNIKKLWAKADKNILLAEKIKKFNYSLPTQELEILETTSGKNSVINYLIYNNFTSKGLTESIPSFDSTGKSMESAHLSIILDRLLKKIANKDDFFARGQERSFFLSLTNEHLNTII